MAKQTIEIEVNQEEADIIIASLNERSGTLTKVHTACMREKQMEAAKEVHKQIKIHENLINFVREKLPE